MLNSKDFSSPQRQSALGIVVNSLLFIKEFVKAIIFPLLIVLIKGNSQITTYLYYGAIGLIIISLIYGYLYYLNFIFYIDENNKEFVLKKGIFSKKQINIPLDKIQLINTNQSVVQRMINVYSLEIDTAGSDKKEVKITSIKHDTAQNLHKTLMLKNATNDSTSDNIRLEEEKSLIQIDSETLIKVGLTSNYKQSILLFISFLIAAYNQIKDVFSAFSSNENFMLNILKNGLSLLSTGFIIGILILTMLFINLIRTLIKYYKFTITQKDNSLILKSGYFSTHQTIIRPNKVQMTTVSQNFFQKKLNFSELNIQQTNAGEEQSSKNTHQNNMTIPGCNPVEKDRILNFILEKSLQKGSCFEPNIRFLNPPILIRVILPLAIFTIIYQFDNSTHEYLKYAIAYFFIAIVMLIYSFKNHKLYVNEEFIIKQQGIWDKKLKIIEPHKIQSISTYQYPWHKSLNIGHLKIHTAGGSISYLFGNYSDIKKLSNLWLYQVESSTKNWM